MIRLKNLPGLATLFSLLFVLASCTTIRYEYFPPASEQGRVCTTHCAGIREICQGNEISRAQADRAACEYRSESIYRNCMRHADNRDEAKDCHRPACWANENTWRCDENYRQCFVACGGTIHTYKDE